MPIGAPGTQSFERVIVKCRNQHIVAGLMPLMTLRQELVTNDEFKDRGGMDNVTRDHFVKHLMNCDRIRRRVTYNPDNTDLKTLIANAIDTEKSIDKGANAAGGDDVQAQSGREFFLPWAFDGTDPDFPPISQLKMVGANGMLFLNSVDLAIVTWTRLESRNRTRFITVMDSMRVYGQYQQILTFLQDFGGDDNRVDIANPLPSDEPLGPQSSPNRKGEIPQQTFPDVMTTTTK